jgi:hypothetical protein
VTHIHTRVVHLDFGVGGGSAAGTIGIPPERYAGAYVRCSGSSLTGFEVTNMGRDLQASTTAADQFLQDLHLGNELLVNGDVVVKASGAAGETADVTLFFSYL